MIKGVIRPDELAGPIAGPNIDPFGRERLGLKLEATDRPERVRRQLERAEPGRRRATSATT